MLKKFALALLVVLLVLPLGVSAQEETEWVEFTSADGSITFSHPADWIVVEDEIGIRVATSQATGDKMDAEEALAAGELALSMLFLPNTAIPELDTTLDPASETYYSDLLTTVELLLLEDEDEAVTDPAVTPEPGLATAEPEAAVDPAATEIALDELPFTLAGYGDANDYTLTINSTGQVFYGRDGNDELNDYSLLVFAADENTTGIAVIYVAAGNSDFGLVLQVATLLESLTYTPAE